MILTWILFSPASRSTESLEISVAPFLIVMVAFLSFVIALTVVLEIGKSTDAEYSITSRVNISFNVISVNVKADRAASVDFVAGLSEESPPPSLPPQEIIRKKRDSRRIILIEIA